VTNNSLRDLSSVYHPAVPGASPSYIAVHVLGEVGTFSPRLRELAAAVDPTLRLHDLMLLNNVSAEGSNEFEFLWRLLAMSSLAITLSLAGIYATVSFAVSRRAPERHRDGDSAPAAHPGRTRRPHRPSWSLPSRKYRPASDCPCWALRWSLSMRCS
jgi:hypothetical protein